MNAPPPPPPPGYQPPPPNGGASTGVLIAMAFAGLALYSILNTVIGFFIFIAAMSDGSTETAYVVAGAVMLALLGLGVGTGLLFMPRTWIKGLGLGLMIGWALWSIVTAGFCTGLNPDLYA